MWQEGEQYLDPHKGYTDLRGRLLPGFVDTHVHYPQTEMIGAFGEQLLECAIKQVELARQAIKHTLLVQAA